MPAEVAVADVRLLAARRCRPASIVDEIAADPELDDLQVYMEQQDQQQLFEHVMARRAEERRRAWWAAERLYGERAAQRGSTSGA